MKYRNISLGILTLLLLVGCLSTVDRSVVEFVKKTKAQKPGAIEALPTFKTAKTFTYDATQLRNPFESFALSTSEKPANIRQEPRPDQNRPKEPLEDYPIDSLRMVGTLERDGIFFALLRDGTGIVHLVQVGNYIGKNSGRIEKISEAELSVREWLQNGKGGWREHWINIPLAK